MESDEKGKKNKEDLDFGELFSPRVSSLGSRPIQPKQDFLKFFIQTLKTLLDEHKASSGGNFASAVFVFLRRFVPFTEIHGSADFQDLLKILTRKDFYQTATRELRERYVRIMLMYMIRRTPADYRNLLSEIESFLGLTPLTLVETLYPDEVAKYIAQRLAGDISTDAPPPKIK